MTISKDPGTRHRAALGNERGLRCSCDCCFRRNGTCFCGLPEDDCFELLTQKNFESVKPFSIERQRQRTSFLYGKDGTDHEKIQIDNESST